jgi:hypothetical protein
MPRTTEQTPVSTAPQPSQRPVDVMGRTIELPRPTPDQQAYLEGIKSSTGHYDPDVIIGGPRRKP